MDLRKLEYFEAVARLLSFTKASEELAVAQPSITNGIKRLEEELGLPLLVRNKQYVSLTPEGELFLKRTRQILRECASAKEEMQNLAVRKAWTLRLGIPPTLGAKVIQLIYCDFLREYPKAKLEMKEIGSTQIREELENNEIDLGYMVLESEHTMNTIPLDCGEVKVLLSGTHPLAGRESLSLLDIANENVICQPSLSYVQRKIEEEFQKSGLKFNGIPMPGYIITTYHLIAHGSGITFVLGDNYRHLVKEMNIRAIPIVPKIPYSAGFAWKKDKKLNLAARACIQLVSERLSGEVSGKI